MSTSSLPNGSIVLNFGDGEPEHSIIWLHGLGATANDFPPIVPELGLEHSRPIRFIFPQAPDRPITINGGYVMPGWYDIKGMSLEDKEDAVGMKESSLLLDALIEQERARGIKTSHIIIAGFSQGGAVVYYTGVRSQHRLAGMLALSTYLPFESLTEEEQTGVNLDTPVFASHGQFDPVVPITMGIESVDSLKNLGYQVRWETYPMEHQVVMEQIKDIGKWINWVFSEEDSR